MTDFHLERLEAEFIDEVLYVLYGAEAHLEELRHHSTHWMAVWRRMKQRQHRESFTPEPLVIPEPLPVPGAEVEYTKTGSPIREAQARNLVRAKAYWREQAGLPPKLSPVEKKRQTKKRRKS